MPKALELDLRAVQAMLRKTPFIHSSEALGPTDDIFGTKDHGYRRVDDFTFLHVLNFEVLQSYQLALARTDLICIQIMITGTYSRWAKDRVDLVSSATTNITNFPRSISDTRAGDTLRGILIVCERQHFVEHFGLRVDHIPEAHRQIFLSDHGLTQALELPTQASVMISADQILSCKFEEPLRSIYINAKVAEIMCDVVAQVNGLSPRQALRGAVHKLKSQTIEAAAAIYRRELGNPPTIERLARRVGLNRNELTSGFRNEFGLTPHAFGRMVRMEEAQKQLRSDGVSVSEVARRVGYGGYASFSRAYHDHFGHPPSAGK
jgi:AraC family transcriptional regulator, transcriptional activator of the genes for pyochelin and ferripyochelin receptors